MDKEKKSVSKNMNLPSPRAIRLKLENAREKQEQIFVRK